MVKSESSKSAKLTTSEKWTKALIYATALSSGILLISNLVATKLWDLFGVAVDGGIVIFPLSYILGDVIVEIFGQKSARNVIFAGFFLNILAVAIFMLVGILPPYAGWEGQEAYMQILGFVPRIVVGSLLAYIASQLLNNFVFEKIRAKTGKKHLFVRSIGSSLLARLVDSGIFETVAFFGVLSGKEFLAQAAFAYFAGMVFEVILTPLTYLVVGAAKRVIGDVETLRA